MSMSLKDVFIDSHRVLNFLRNNQLVQAHGLCCRIETSLQDMLRSPMGCRPYASSEPKKLNDIPSQITNEPKKSNEPSPQVTNDPKKSSEPENQNEQNEPGTKTAPSREGATIEQHPQWKPFKEILKVKQAILAGDTKTATEYVSTALRMLAKS